MSLLWISGTLIYHVPKDIQDIVLGGDFSITVFFVTPIYFLPSFVC